MGTPFPKPTEVFRISRVALWIAILVALILQTFLPLKFPLARLADFPLLVTIYFALMRRDKILAILLGTCLGLTQDALSHGFIGIFGMAKALIAYLAASASVRFELESLLIRSALTGALVLTQNVFLWILQRALLEIPPPFRPLAWISAILTNVALGLVIYQVLDRFKQPA